MADPDADVDVWEPVSLTPEQEALLRRHIEQDNQQREGRLRLLFEFAITFAAGVLVGALLF